MIAGMGLARWPSSWSQRQGFGSQLVRRGLEILRERGCAFVVVPGHAMAGVSGVARYRKEFAEKRLIE